MALPKMHVANKNGGMACRSGRRFSGNLGGGGTAQALEGVTCEKCRAFVTNGRAAVMMERSELTGKLYPVVRLK